MVTIEAYKGEASAMTRQHRPSIPVPYDALSRPSLVMRLQPGMQWLLTHVRAPRGRAKAAACPDVSIGYLVVLQLRANSLGASTRCDSGLHSRSSHQSSDRTAPVAKLD